MRLINDSQNLLRNWLNSDGKEDERELESTLVEMSVDELTQTVLSIRDELTPEHLADSAGTMMEFDRFIPIAVMCMNWMHELGWRRWGFRFDLSQSDSRWDSFEEGFWYPQSRVLPSELVTLLQHQRSFGAWALLDDYELERSSDLLKPLISRGLQLADESYGEVIKSATRLEMYGEIESHAPARDTKAFVYFLQIALSKGWVKDELSLLQELLQDDEPVIRAAAIQPMCDSKLSDTDLRVRVEDSEPEWFLATLHHYVDDGVKFQMVSTNER